MSRAWTALFSIVAAAALVFFVNLGRASLFDEDEAIHATCAREMFEQDQWVVPSFNGRMFPDKPPLMFWMMMAAYRVFGVTELAARLPAAILGVATALATYALGKRLFRWQVGFWAGLIMTSTIIFTVSARAATVDAALTFLTTVALGCFFHGRQDKSRSWRWFALGYAALGVAVLGKGPVGVVLPGAVFCLFLWITNHIEYNSRGATGGLSASVASARAASWPWHPYRDGWAQRLGAWVRPFGLRNLCTGLWQMRPLTATAIVAAVALPWYVLVGVRTHGTWLAEFFGVHNLHRALAPMHHRSGPFLLYYIAVILVGFFPWSAFIVPSLGNLVRRLRQSDMEAVQNQRQAPCISTEGTAQHATSGNQSPVPVSQSERAAYILLACWIGVYVLFWSLISTKFPHYVLPAYPALALMTAAFLDGWLRDPARAKKAWMRGAAATLIVVGIGIAVAMPFVSALLLPGEAVLGVIGLILVIGGAACLAFHERGRPSRAVATFAATALVFVTSIFGFAVLRVDRHQSSPPLMAQIREDSPGPSQIAAYGFFRPTFVYYAGHPVSYCTTVEALQEFAEHAPRPYVITTSDHEDKVRRIWPGELGVMARMPCFFKRADLVVLTPTPISPVAQTAQRH
jgi:4-amino-4-deoxy-L-arabinose transferase-like glycosyltransferase